jgi:hypothetical protein
MSDHITGIPKLTQSQQLRLGHSPDERICKMVRLSVPASLAVLRLALRLSGGGD